jgi:hypothetical protein
MRARVRTEFRSVRGSVTRTVAGIVTAPPACWRFGCAVAEERDEKLRRLLVPAGDHTAGDLAISPIHTQLPRRRGFARRACVAEYSGWPKSLDGWPVNRTRSSRAKIYRVQTAVGPRAGAPSLIAAAPPMTAIAAWVTAPATGALSHLARGGSLAAPCRLPKTLNLLNPSRAVRQVMSSKSG